MGTLGRHRTIYLYEDHDEAIAETTMDTIQEASLNEDGTSMKCLLGSGRHGREGSASGRRRIGSRARESSGKGEKVNCEVVNK